MRVIETNESIKTYYEEVKDQYPDVTFAQFEEAIKASFYAFVKGMESVLFPIVKIKYLGKFLVYPAVAKAMMKKNDRDLVKGFITQEIHDIMNDNLQNYLLWYETSTDDDPSDSEEEASE